MEFKIKIDEDKLQEAMMDILAQDLLRKYSEFRRDLNYCVKESITDICRKEIYSKKDNLIEKIVERASKELVKKGLPKLLEKMEEIK